MKYTTTLNKEYALRFLGVVALFLGLAGWFYYDGAIGYLKENEAYAKVAQPLSEKNLSPQEWMNTAKTGISPLQAAFQSAGMKRVPGKVLETFTSVIGIGSPEAQEPAYAANVLTRPLHSQDDIHAQFYSAAIAMAAALGLLGLVCFRYATKISLEEECLVIVRGAKSLHYALDEIKQIDDAQWEKRGILKIVFNDERRVVLDAWHYAGIRPIVAEIMKRKV